MSVADHPHAELVFALSLPPVLSKVFVLLMSEQRVTNDMINDVVKLAEPKYTMFRLRKTLNKYNVDIKSKRYYGYWLEPSDKKKLAEVATPESNSQ